MHGRLWLLISRDHPQAFPEPFAQSNRAAMFLQKIAECFFGKVLQPLAGVEGKPVQRVPSLGIKFYATADW